MLALFQLRLEHRGEIGLLFRSELVLRGIILRDQPLDDIRVDPGKPGIFQLHFHMVHEVDVELTVEKQNIIPFGPGRLYITVLLVLIGGIQVNQCFILIGLLRFYQLLVLLEGKIFSVCILQQGKLRCTLIELLLGDHSIVDEQLQVVPLLLELRPVILKDLLKLISHLLHDMRRYLLHIGIALQVAPRYVQRYIGRVEHTMQQGQELGYDILHRIGNEHLVGVKLNLVSLHLNIVADLRKIEDPCKVERVIHVQVNIEQRLIGHRVEVAVEFRILLLFHLRRCDGPERLYIIDYIVLFGLHLFSILPILLLSKGDFNRQKAAIFVEHLTDPVIFQELLGILVDMQDHIGTSPVALSLFEGEFRTAVAAPFVRLFILLP